MSELTKMGIKGKGGHLFGDVHLSHPEFVRGVLSMSAPSSAQFAAWEQADERGPRFALVSFFLSEAEMLAF